MTSTERKALNYFNDDKKLATMIKRVVVWYKEDYIKEVLKNSMKTFLTT